MTAIRYIINEPCLTWSYLTKMHWDTQFTALFATCMIKTRQPASSRPKQCTNSRPVKTFLVVLTDTAFAQWQMTAEICPHNDSVAAPPLASQYPLSPPPLSTFPKCTQRKHSKKKKKKDPHLENTTLSFQCYLTQAIRTSSISFLTFLFQASKHFVCWHMGSCKQA